MRSGAPARRQTAGDELRDALRLRKRLFSQRIKWRSATRAEFLGTGGRVLILRQRFSGAPGRLSVFPGADLGVAGTVLGSAGAGLGVAGKRPGLPRRRLGPVSGETQGRRCGARDRREGARVGRGAAPVAPDGRKRVVGRAFRKILFDGARRISYFSRQPPTPLAPLRFSPPRALCAFPFSERRLFGRRSSPQQQTPRAQKPRPQRS